MRTCSSASVYSGLASPRSRLHPERPATIANGGELRARCLDLICFLRKSSGSHVRFLRKSRLLQQPHRAEQSRGL
jgi:hypothetical protein